LVLFQYSPESALAYGVRTSGYTDSQWTCHGTVRRKNGTEAPFKLKNLGPTDTVEGAANIVRARHKAADATTQKIDCYHYSSDSVPVFTDDDGLADGNDMSAQKDVNALGRCKCVGDSACGGGQIYEVCYSTQKNCKNAQKDLDDYCNNKDEMKKKCTRPKCYYRHSDPTYPANCSL
jgi:hypothetical protein